MTPNPGSDAALDLGCKCPVLDNGHGRGIPWPNDDDDGFHTVFWQTEGCPVHAWPPAQPDQEVADAPTHEEGSCNCPACSGDWDFVNQCERGTGDPSGTAEADAPCE